VGLDVSIDDLPSRWVHGYRAGTVYGAIGDDGLAVDALERCRRFVGGDNLLVGRHG